jgi:DNA-binding response OmpR family regulator
MRILLVEDNRRLSDSLRLNLVDEGYAVDVAYDGQEGEELAELTPYAVIILDVMLPLPAESSYQNADPDAYRP